MPAAAPPLLQSVEAQLSALGAEIRAHRKHLGVNATSTAEAAGLSRVTLFRVEKGEPSVTMGAYLNVLSALGLKLSLGPAAPVKEPANHGGWIPARIQLAEYPQLKKLAWQVHGTDALTPTEAWSIYERNMRHIDQDALGKREKELIEALGTAFASMSVPRV